MAKKSPAAATTQYGPQYGLDDNFKKSARLHQSMYRASTLGLAEYKDYGNRLSDSDAAKGLNFYNGFGILDAVTARYGNKPAVVSDMLRSEHIPFNLFIPLTTDLEYATRVFNIFLRGAIRTISSIRIEHAPDPKQRYLDDNTSFDAYVEYCHVDGSKGGLGIEVKYTEREYPYGVTERKRMDDPNSGYNTFTGKIGIYDPAFVPRLKEPRYKQLWRNQLLGEKMVDLGDLSHFTSVLFFPSGNSHFVQVCAEYCAGLSVSAKELKFAPVTYEKYIAAASALASSAAMRAWVEYLGKRYIV